MGLTMCGSRSVAALAVLVVHATAHGQSLARRVAEAPQGLVQLTFASRAGVCGDGGRVIMVDGSFFGSLSVVKRRGEWPPSCMLGPVRVLLTRDGPRVTRVRTHVGGPPRALAYGVTDLGTVPAKDAAEYLLSIAAHSGTDVGEDALLPAALADSATIWPSLLTIARDAARPRATRHAAMFWLARAAAESAGVPIDDRTDGEDDESVRAHAVFALSQLSDDTGVPALIDIARSHRSPRVRGRAIFWLGESGDPRAIALFEELLAGRGGGVNAPRRQKR